MSNKLVSVVIPTYKRPEMLSRAIHSVLKQTYSPLEIIVVDDNGTDSDEHLKTLGVVEKYLNQIVYIVHEKNKGGSAARNSGWRAAHGEYITFLDDDDEIMAEKIEYQVECLEKQDGLYGACYTAYKILGMGGRKQISATNVVGSVYLQALARNFYVGSGSNLLFRKIAVDTVGGYDESFIRNQDIEFMARIFEHYKVAFVDKTLLLIHQEIRNTRRSFEEADRISTYYIEKFAPKINKLGTVAAKKVYKTIALDRARIAIQSYGEYRAAIRILSEYHVGLFFALKYIFHLIYRRITHKSFGFVA